MHKICEGCAQEMPASATICSLCGETLGKVFIPPRLDMEPPKPKPKPSVSPYHLPPSPRPPAKPNYPPPGASTDPLDPPTPAPYPPQSSMAMFCNQCGKQMAPGKNFCGHCGAVTPTQPEPTSPGSSSEKTVLLFQPNTFPQSDPQPFTVTEPGPPPFAPAAPGPVPFAPPQGAPGSI